MERNRVGLQGWTMNLDGGVGLWMMDLDDGLWIVELEDG